MGYHTRYGLDVIGETNIDHYSEIQKTFELDFEEAKWHDYEQNMCDYSKKYPNLIFVLSGDDGESDLWKDYYKNGLVQSENAVISYGDFDPEKLKEPEALRKQRLALSKCMGTKKVPSGKVYKRKEKHCGKNKEPS